MIKVSDYYNEGNSTIANYPQFVEDRSSSEVFPFEGIYIGELESITHHKLPALLSFEEINGLCFLKTPQNDQLISRVIQSIVLRFVASLPTDLCRLYLFDGTGLGSNLITLSNLSSKITGGEIITDPMVLLRSLKTIQGHIPNVIQKVLGYKHSDKTLIEYNSFAPEQSVLYNFLVITDYPHYFSKEHFDTLQMILKNCKRAGVFVIMSLDTTYVNSNTYNEVSFMDILGDMTTIYEKDDRYYVANSQHDDIFRRFKLTLDTSFLDNVEEVLEYIKSKEKNDKETRAISLVDYLPSKKMWWKGRSAEKLSVPFGVSNKQVLDLKITQEDAQNSAVVIGVPGSGKSVFLHTLICSAAVNYSPDELNMYLIDFSGVEFNPYALHNLPHARVIAPEAEREFGLSILNELVEEGSRRMALCRSNNVSNIVELKAVNPSLYVPRLLVIIDEFQKIFEVDNDYISKAANTAIHNIIQEFRKFGINLVLATQKLPSTSILPKDLIANRVVFKSSPADFSSLISMPSGAKMPLLRKGECIYNSESGAADYSHMTQGFLVTKQDIDNLLDQISEHSDKSNYKREYDLRVFRGNELPEFGNRRVEQAHLMQSERPESVGVYLGEAISIQDTDVCVSLRKESANNLLVLGGEPHVAQRIAYYATVSATTAHTDQSSIFITLNFLRKEDALNNEIQLVFNSLPFVSQVVSKGADVLDALSVIKQEIELRRKDEESEQKHIYLSIYGFQYGRVFDMTVGRYGEQVSEYGELLDFILKNGPTVGVFTILQCDTLDSLMRIGNVLSHFSYRVALQMTEAESNKVVGSSIASKLFEFQRPSSVNRAYLVDHKRNTNIKFKPYK